MEPNPFEPPQRVLTGKRPARTGPRFKERNLIVGLLWGTCLAVVPCVAVYEQVRIKNNPEFRLGWSPLLVFASLIAACLMPLFAGIPWNRRLIMSIVTPLIWVTVLLLTGLSFIFFGGFVD